MSKKKIVKVAKLQFPAGGAKPGPALASAGINMPQFCSAFNDATRDRAGDMVPVIITAYEDKSFDFVLKTTPAAILIKKAAKISKAASNQKQTVGTITADQVREIAEYKMPDLNANSIEAAMRIIAGTARNMGIAVKGLNDVELAEQEKEAHEEEAEREKREEELAEMEAEVKEGTTAEVEVIGKNKEEQTEE